MNFMDAWRLAMAVDDVKGQIADAADSALGDRGQMLIPDAEKLNALLVKGKGGRRVRIVGILYQREK